MTTRRTPLMDISNNDVTSSPVTTEGNRRKSGRAVKAPRKFILEQSSQPGPASAKRKRGDEDVENDASDIDELAEESDENIESAGEEEVRETRKKAKAKSAKKPAAKKPKVNGTLSHDDAPAVQLPNRPKKAKKVAIADDIAEGLFAEVFTTDDSLEDVASQWLTRHGENGPLALTELVNFLLKSAGCDIEVTEDHINDPDNADTRLGDIQGDFQAQNITDYPLISKKTSHAFRSSFVGFFEHLVKAMHDSGVMYEDPALFQNLHVWVAAMTSSTSRPFRHTSTLVALTISTAMCRAASQEISIAAKVLRQLEGEKKKKGANKARLKDFQNKVATNERRKAFIEDQLKEYFNTVYTHRYRDVDARIRLECVEALGTWILTLPSYFFEGQFLRYMGWMLSDTHGPMRHETMKQLLKIMKDPSNHGGMRHFIERFRTRMIEMATNDSDPTVRASAIDLVDTIRHAGFLEPDDIDTIGKLIFDTEPKVRKALVGFFAENIKDLYDSKVDELGGEEALEDVVNVEDEEDFDTPRAGWIRYKCLAEILLSYDIEDQDEFSSETIGNKYLNVTDSESRFTLAAQALYEKVEDLKDWETLAGYLLFDHTSRSAGSEAEQALKTAFKPDEQEELILLDILNSVVKLSLAPIDDSEKSKDKSKRKQARLTTSEAMETTARRLASLIPRLLKKYGPNPRTATIVLRLEHVMNLSVFQELRQDSTAYAKLLDEISAQFNAHADNGVLKEASAAFLHARGYEELEEVTENKVQSLWDDTISVLRKINKVGEVSVRGGLGKKILTELSHNLARLAQLSAISSSVEHLEAEAGKDDTLPITILLDIVARGVFEESNDEALDVLEDEAVLSAIHCGMFYFMWKVRALIDTINAGEEVLGLDIDHLKEWQETFAQNLIATFSSRSTLDPVRLLGAGTLLDVHTLFSSLRPSKNGKGNQAISQANPYNESAHLQTLIQEIVPEVQTEITSIFEGLEKHFAKRSKKKLAEPSEDEEPEDLEDEPEDDEDEDVTDNDRQNETLKAEKELCDFTGKLVLAILAGVIDASGPAKGKLRPRIQRSRQTLGSSFKEVIAYLDDPKSKNKKSHKSKAQQDADAAKRAAKSKALVEEEDEEDIFAEEEPEEGTAEDMRRRELLDEEPVASEDGEGEVENDEEDEIMGD